MADGQHGWFNTGLYGLAESRYQRDVVSERTGRVDDIGRYRTPTLRHLAFTAPYYPDGTGATLGDVLKNYNAGGRITSSGPNVGDGRMNRYKDHRIEPLGLSERELKDLEAFLLSLTDMTVLDRAEWSDPWSRIAD